jgi:hypothetical protein
MDARRKRRSRRSSSVSASELAQMGRCETLVLFEHLPGSRPSAKQERARKRGLLAHDQFYREGLEVASAAATRRGRCFVATRVFGEAWQTQVMRRFRDVALRPRPWGRWLIGCYYRAAPGVCSVLRRWPFLQLPVRVVLNSVAAGLRWGLGRLGKGA